ncbi:MAG: SMC-Scp complex subunit ScpB [Candidatus Marinimicrobia bacterium]|nr:SMC-Scp complex subunit ScpB [Candidatus Neomarinimicrobiota bacterium]MCF7850507.1 SMC-Scp complex subunit ScpB [Candidatus Neomarinimicrobiota bacterium]MCF7903980.1 SMC-Scp complex subunit ScpB [Candidatus Neomarinimicrobiota bacterium]
MELTDLKKIVEALLMASPIPLTETRFKMCMKDEAELTLGLEEIIESLQADYDDSGRAFTIKKVAGGYQLVTRADFEIYVKGLFTKTGKLRLSQAALETLAIVSYRQPVTRNEIEAIRGVNSDSSIRTLLDRKLLEIRGRDDGPGRALLYRTSTEFLQYFGLDSVKDLPKLKEVEDLLSEDQQELV